MHIFIHDLEKLPSGNNHGFDGVAVSAFSNFESVAGNRIYHHRACAHAFKRSIFENICQRDMGPDRLDHLRGGGI